MFSEKLVDATMLSDVTKSEAGRAFLFCNEAIVRGALEAGVKVAAFYPGSPVSEILDIFDVISPQMNIKMEIATNEKVAIETIAGGSMAGQRGLTAMKSVGLNVAADAFHSLAYTGVNKGCVVIVADDPFCHSSQTEQDGRLYAPSAYIPLLEPTSPEEAKAMVKKAFEISEQFSTIVMIRTSTRINHQSAIVNLDPLPLNPFIGGDFRSSGQKFATVGAKARELKLKLLDKIKLIQESFETSEFNENKAGSDSYGVIVSGISYNYVLEAAHKLHLTPHVLKLGTTYPLPEKLIQEFIHGLSIVIIVEELSPFLELRIRAIAKDVNPSLKIIGKSSGHFSEAFEYNIPLVTKVFKEAFGGTASPDYDAILHDANTLKGDLIPRVPVFCPGCPHRATFWAVQKALAGKENKLAFMNDIGCYSMLLLNADIYSKIHADDLLLSMGSCLGVSCGVAMGSGGNNLVMAVVGDSTFFHAGMPGVLNLAYHGDDVKLLVLDNSVTAMTGQQANPGTGYGSSGKPAMQAKIEDVLHALGVEKVIIVNPFDTKTMSTQIKPVLESPGLAAIISRGPCALWNDRNKRRRGEKIRPYYVDQRICHKCHTCMRDFYCPAISMKNEKTEYTDEKGKKWVGYSSYISPDLCDGCGVCSILCPYTNYLARSEKDVIKPLEKMREIRHDL